MKNRQCSKQDQYGRITYSMHYHFNLHTNLFIAIKNKTKHIEGRAMRNENDRYKNIVQGDIIIFENEENHELITTEVQFVRHYRMVKEMLTSEGIKNILPEIKSIEEGIRKYESIPTYKERVKKFGIYAIGIKVV